MNKRYPKKGRAGFSLVELMMAMVITSLGLFAVAQMCVVSVRGNGYAREWMEAYDIAQSAMEEVKTRASQWMKFTGEVGPNYNQTVLENMIPVASIVNMPPAGTDLNWNDFRSLLLLHGKAAATGTAVTDSNTINIYGDNVGKRRTYRVHYLAHWFPVNACPSINPAIPCDQGNSGSNLLRLTVFVSWDNKDHGDQRSPWDNIAAETDYWKRHTVSVTTFLGADYSWTEGIWAP